VSKKDQQSWLGALEKQGLEVKSARDALQVKGWLDTGNYALNWAFVRQLGFARAAGADLGEDGLQAHGSYIAGPAAQVPNAARSLAIQGA